MSNCVWLSSTNGTAAPHCGPRSPSLRPYTSLCLLPRAGRSGLGSPVRAEGLAGTLGQWAAGGLPGPRTRGAEAHPFAATGQINSRGERGAGGAEETQADLGL